LHRLLLLLHRLLRLNLLPQRSQEHQPDARPSLQIVQSHASLSSLHLLEHIRAIPFKDRKSSMGIIL
jgi:hypothetical protein